MILHDTTFTVKIQFAVFTAVRFAIRLRKRKTVQDISAVRISSDIVVGWWPECWAGVRSS